ncbi:hypothetical protein ACQ4PT_013915 [Festuca glaucescens]
MEGWLSLCFIALSTLLLFRFLKLFSKPGKQLPPGPWTLPVIGSLHHVISSLPHRRMMELSRQHGPLLHLMLGEVPTVVVSSAEAASLVMKTNDLVFANRPRGPTQDIVGCGGQGIIFGPYGDRWRQMRKICVVELLSSKQVRRMENIKATEVGNLLRSIARRGPSSPAVNLTAKMAALSNDVVARAIFGGKRFSLADLFPSSRLVRWLSNGERHLRRSYGVIQRITTDIIEARREARASNCRASSADDEDLVDVLLRLQEEDSLAFPLTTEIICVVILDIFGAATDTTATTLVWAMSELLRNPIILAKVQSDVRNVLGRGRSVITSADLSELSYLRMVIKEVLRLHPPGPFLIPRETREDCEMMGYAIPKGTNIFVNVFAISRDSKNWDNPEVFNPERFDKSNIDYYGTNFEFTPFGAGRRQCPGILFGASTLEITLANMLYHFDWVLPDGSSTPSLDMSEKFGVTVSRKYDLELIATPNPYSKIL